MMNIRPWRFSILFLVLLSFNHHATGARVFYIIGNMANDLPQVEKFLAEGANGVAVDVQFSLDGRPTRTSHGFPCSCFRNCFTSDIFKHVMEHLRDITTPEVSGTSDVKLALIFLNLRVQFLGGGALYVAGKRLGEALLMYYFEGGMSGANGWVVLSVPTSRHALLFQGVKDVFEEHEAMAVLDQIGFDIGSNEPFNTIYDTFVSLGINEHRWVGDGVSNCLIRSTDRLEALLDERDLGEARFSRVYHWTIDSPPNLRQSLRLGVDAIITNRPDRLLTVLEEDEFFAKYRLATPEDRPWSTVIQGGVSLPSSSIDFDPPSTSVGISDPDTLTISSPGEADLTKNNPNSDKDCTKSSSSLSADDDLPGLNLAFGSVDETAKEATTTTTESSSDISETKDLDIKLPDDDLSSTDVSKLVDLLKGRTTEEHHPYKKSLFQSEDLADAIRKISDRSSMGNSESDGELTKVLIELLKNVNTPAPSSSVPVDVLMALMASQAPPPSPSVPLELAAYLLRPPQPNPTTQLLDLLRPSYGSSSVPMDTLRLLLELQSRSPQSSLPLSLLQPSPNYGGNPAVMSLLLSSLQSKPSSLPLNSLLPLLLSSKLSSTDLSKVLSALTSSNKGSKSSSPDNSKNKNTQPASEKNKQQTGRELDDITSTTTSNKDSSKSSADNTKQSSSKPKGRDANCNRNLTKNFPLSPEFDPSFRRPSQPLSTMVMADIGPDGVYFDVYEKPARVPGGIGPSHGNPFLPHDLLKTSASQATKDKQNKDAGVKLLSSGFVPNVMPIQLPMTPFGRPPFPGNGFRPPFRPPRLPPVGFNRPFRPVIPPRPIRHPPRLRPILRPCPYPGAVGCGPNTHSYASPNYGPMSGPMRDIVKYPTGKGTAESYYSYRTKGLIDSTHDHRTLPPYHAGPVYKPPVFIDTETTFSGHSHDFKSSVTGGSHSVKISTNGASNGAVPSLKDSKDTDSNRTLDLMDTPFVISAVKDSNTEAKINQADTIEDIMDLLKSPTTTVATPTNDPDEPVIPTLEQLNNKGNLAAILEGLTSSTAKSTAGTTNSALDEDSLIGLLDSATESQLDKDKGKVEKGLLPQDEFLSSLLSKPEPPAGEEDEKSTTEFPPLSLNGFGSTLAPIHSDLAAHLAILSGKWPAEISVTRRPSTTTNTATVIETPASMSDSAEHSFDVMETTTSTPDKTDDDGGRVDSSFPGRNETLLPPTGGLGWNGNGVDLKKLQELLSEHTGKRMEVIIIENTPLIFVPSSVPGMRAQQLAKLSELAGSSLLASTTSPPFDEFDQHTSTTRKRAATFSPLEVNDLESASGHIPPTISPSLVTAEIPEETEQQHQVPVDFTISKPSQGLSHLLSDEKPTVSSPKEEKEPVSEISDESHTNSNTNNDQIQSTVSESNLEILLPERFGLRLEKPAVSKHLPNEPSTEILIQDEDNRNKEPIQQIVKHKPAKELEHSLTDDHIETPPSKPVFPFLVHDSEELIMAETTQMPIIHTQRKPLTYDAEKNENSFPSPSPHQSSINRHKQEPSTVNKQTTFQTDSIHNPAASFNTATKHSSNSTFVSIIRKENVSTDSSENDSERGAVNAALHSITDDETVSKNITESFMEHFSSDESISDTYTFSDPLTAQLGAVGLQSIKASSGTPFSTKDPFHPVAEKLTPTGDQQTHQSPQQDSLKISDLHSSINKPHGQKLELQKPSMGSTLNEEDFFEQNEKHPSIIHLQTHQHQHNFHADKNREKSLTGNMESIKSVEESTDDSFRLEDEKLTPAENHPTTHQSSVRFQSNKDKPKQHKIEPPISVEESLLSEKDFLKPDGEKLSSTESLQHHHQHHHQHNHQHHHQHYHQHQHHQPILPQGPHIDSTLHKPEKHTSKIIKSTADSLVHEEDFLNHETEKQSPSKSFQTQQQHHILPEKNPHFPTIILKPQKDTSGNLNSNDDSIVNEEHFLTHDTEQKLPAKTMQAQNQYQTFTQNNPDFHALLPTSHKEKSEDLKPNEHSTINEEDFLNHETEIRPPTKIVHTQQAHQFFSEENPHSHSVAHKAEKETSGVVVSTEDSKVNAEDFFNHETENKPPTKTVHTQQAHQFFSEKNPHSHSVVHKPEKETSGVVKSTEASKVNEEDFFNHETENKPSTKIVHTQQAHQFFSEESPHSHSVVHKAEKETSGVVVSTEDSKVNVEDFFNHETKNKPSTKTVHTQQAHQFFSEKNPHSHSVVHKPEKETSGVVKSTEASNVNEEDFFNHETENKPSTKIVHTQQAHQFFSEENPHSHSVVHKAEKDPSGVVVSTEDSKVNAEDFFNHKTENKPPTKIVHTQQAHQFFSEKNPHSHSVVHKPEKETSGVVKSTEASKVNEEDFFNHETENKPSTKIVHTQQAHQFFSEESPHSHSVVHKAEKETSGVVVSTEDSKVNVEDFFNHETKNRPSTNIVHTQQAHQFSSQKNPHSNSAVDNLENETLGFFKSIEESGVNEEDVLNHKTENKLPTKTVQTQQAHQFFSEKNPHSHSVVHTLKKETSGVLKSIEDSRVKEDDFLNYETENKPPIKTEQTQQANQFFSKKNPQFDSVVHKPEKETSGVLKSIEESGVNEEDFSNHETEKMPPTKTMQTQQAHQSFSEKNPHFDSVVHKPEKETSEVLKSIEDSIVNEEDFLNHETENKPPIETVQTQKSHQFFSEKNPNSHSIVHKPEKETSEVLKSIEDSTVNEKDFLNHETEIRPPTKTVQTQQGHEFSSEKNPHSHSAGHKHEKETSGVLKSPEDSTANEKDFLNHETEIKPPTKTMQTQDSVHQLFSEKDLYSHSVMHKPEKETFGVLKSIEYSTVNEEDVSNHAREKKPSTETMQAQQQYQIPPEKNPHLHAILVRPQKETSEVIKSVENSTENAEKLFKHEVEMPSVNETVKSLQSSPVNLQFHSSGGDKMPKEAPQTLKFVNEATVNDDHLKHTAEKQPQMEGVEAQEQHQNSPEISSGDEFKPETSLEETKSPHAYQNHHQSLLKKPTFHGNMNNPQQVTFESTRSAEEITVNKQHTLKTSTHNLSGDVSSPYKGDPTSGEKYFPLVNIHDTHGKVPYLETIGEHVINEKDAFRTKMPLHENKLLPQSETQEIHLTLESSLEEPKLSTSGDEALKHKFTSSASAGKLMFEEKGVLATETLFDSSTSLFTDESIQVPQDILDSVRNPKVYIITNEPSKDHHGALYSSDNEGATKFPDISNSFSLVGSHQSQNPNTINDQQQENFDTSRSVTESSFNIDSSLIDMKFLETNYETRNTQSFLVHHDYKSTLGEPEINVSLDEQQLKTFVGLNTNNETEVDIKTISTEGTLPESDEREVSSTLHAQQTMVLNSDNLSQQNYRFHNGNTSPNQSNALNGAGSTSQIHVEQSGGQTHSSHGEISVQSPKSSVATGDSENGKPNLTTIAAIERFNTEEFGLKLQLSNRPSTNFSSLLESFANNNLPAQNKPVFTGKSSSVNAISSSTLTNIPSILSESKLRNHPISSPLNIKPVYESTDEFNLRLRNFGPSPALPSTVRNAFPEAESIAEGHSERPDMTQHTSNNGAGYTHDKDVYQPDLYKSVERPLDSSFLSHNFTATMDDKLKHQNLFLEESHNLGEELMVSTDSLIAANVDSQTLHEAFDESPFITESHYSSHTMPLENNATTLHKATLSNPVKNHHHEPSNTFDIATTHTNMGEAGPTKTVISSTGFQHNLSLDSQETLDLVVRKNPLQKTQSKTNDQHTVNGTPALVNPDEFANEGTRNKNNPTLVNANEFPTKNKHNQNSNLKDISSLNNPSIVSILNKKQSSTDLADDHQKTSSKSPAINEMPLKETLSKDEQHGFLLGSEVQSNIPLTGLPIYMASGSVHVLPEQSSYIPKSFMSSVVKEFDESQQLPLHQISEEKVHNKDFITDEEINVASKSEKQSHQQLLNMPIQSTKSISMLDIDNTPKFSNQQHHQTNSLSKTELFLTSADINKIYSGSPSPYLMNNMNSNTAKCTTAITSHSTTNLEAAFKDYLAHTSAPNSENPQNNLPSNQLHSTQLLTQQPKNILTPPELETSIPHNLPVTSLLREAPLQTQLASTLQASGAIHVQDKANANVDKISSTHGLITIEQLLSSYTNKDNKESTFSVIQDITITPSIKFQHSSSTPTNNRTLSDTRSGSPEYVESHSLKHDDHRNFGTNHPTQQKPAAGGSVAKQRPHVLSLRVPIPRPPVPTLRRPPLQTKRVTSNITKNSHVTPNNKFPLTLGVQSPHVSVQHKGSATPPPKSSSIHNGSRINHFSTKINPYHSSSGLRSASAAQHHFLNNITRLPPHIQTVTHSPFSAPVPYPDKPHTIVTIQPATSSGFTIFHFKNDTAGAPLHRSKDGAISVISVPGPQQQSGFSITVKNVHESRDSDRHSSRHQKTVTAQTLEIERMRKAAQRRMDMAGRQESPKPPGTIRSSGSQPVHGTLPRHSSSQQSYLSPQVNRQMMSSQRQSDSLQKSGIRRHKPQASAPLKQRQSDSLHNSGITQRQQQAPAPLTQRQSDSLQNSGVTRRLPQASAPLTQRQSDSLQNSGIAQRQHQAPAPLMERQSDSLQNSGVTRRQPQSSAPLLTQRQSDSLQNSGIAQRQPQASAPPTQRQSDFLLNSGIARRQPQTSAPSVNSDIRQRDNRMTNVDARQGVRSGFDKPPVNSLTTVGDTNIPIIHRPRGYSQPVSASKRTLPISSSSENSYTSLRRQSSRSRYVHTDTARNSRRL